MPVRRPALLTAVILAATATVVVAERPRSAVAAEAAGDRVAHARARAAAIGGQVAALRRQLDAVAVRVEEEQARFGEAVTDHLRAERAADAAFADRARRDAVRVARVRSLYARGGAAALYASLLDAGDPADVVTRYRTVESVLQADELAQGAATARATALARAASDRDGEVEARVRRERRARALAAEVQTLLAGQQALLASADAEVARILDEDRRRAARAALDRARRRSADAAAHLPRVDARSACPVGPAHSFVDTWGAPRSGGRRHQGTDVFAPHGSAAYAVVDGVVANVGDDGGRGGLRLWLRADSGDAFYYAHNSENLVREGQRVRAGQIVARVGTSGNAVGTPPHVHFESHPGERGPVNPYSFLRTVCG